MRKIIPFFILCFCLLCTPCLAASTAWQQSEEIAVRLLSETEGTKGLNKTSLALEIMLANGWHTYWRSPGDAGTPPTFDWSKSTGLNEATLRYPAPKRYSLMGMDTIGYEGHVIFPIDVILAQTGAPLKIETTLNILVCGTLCLPRQFHLMLDLKNDTNKKSNESEAIDIAISKTPLKQDYTLFFSEITRGKNTLQVTVQSDEKLNQPDLFIESEDGLLFDRPTAGLGPDKQTALFTTSLTSPLEKGKTLSDYPLTLTVVEHDHAIERYVDPENKATTKASNLSFSLLLCLALLGGLILNLMPCVLPVLSLKIMSIIRHGGNHHHSIRHSFLSTAAGVLFSFLILALATIALKTTGQAIGWGIQFQHPVFLFFMITLLVFFAANLWGFFTIHPPHAVEDLANPQHHPKLAGDFATGALATLLATPCSAPFLGTAVAFAMASGTSEIIAIFTALGLGMSLPYLAVALYPRLASSLPHPGPWMITLSHFLGFGLAGTAVWLLFILHMQIGTFATSTIAIAMVTLALYLFLRHKNKISPRKLIGFLGIFSFMLFIAFLTATPIPQNNEANGPWIKYDEEALSQYLLEGKTVFVDVTADWCLTCKFNKRFTLERERVQKRLFHDPNVIAMQADWTNPDPVVTGFLNRNNRYGVPFNVIYGPNEPDGIPLPELLSPDILIKALDQAKATNRKNKIK